MTRVSIQEEDFDPGALIEELGAHNNAGAVTSFVGLVRDTTNQGALISMTLEHYAGMTEKALHHILEQAHEKWSIEDSLIIHRIGRLKPRDRIVFVAIASKHREETFLACHFVIDYLKTQAPFWKREETIQGVHWVDARTSDNIAAERWRKT